MTFSDRWAYKRAEFFCNLKIKTKMALECLPTGFDKIFQLLPWMLKEMWNFECSTVVIVTPLVFIMKDKVKELSSLSLRAFAIGLITVFDAILTSRQTRLK